MSGYAAVDVISRSTPNRGEVNHNTSNGIRCSRATQVLNLPGNGRVEIVASRLYGKQVTHTRQNDTVTLSFSYGDEVHVTVANGDKAGPDFLQKCGSLVPRKPAILDILVSSFVLVYSLLLTCLLAYVRGNWYYLTILFIWFFYVVLRVSWYNKRLSGKAGTDRNFWHLTGISFGLIFMYATMMILLPFITRTVFYEAAVGFNQWTVVSYLMPALKASVALTLLGMAARRRFHCGEILQNADLIRTVLLDNVDIFNLVGTLGLGNGGVVTKGSALEVWILLICVLAFIVVIFECLVPYALFTQNIGESHSGLQFDAEVTKQRTITMVYPYSLLFLNTPFLVTRLVLFGKFNVLQLAYIVKNVMCIIFGLITLVQSRNALKQQNVNQIFSSTIMTEQNRRFSV